LIVLRKKRREKTHFLYTLFRFLFRRSNFEWLPRRLSPFQVYPIPPFFRQKMFTADGFQRIVRRARFRETQPASQQASKHGKQAWQASMAS